MKRILVTGIGGIGGHNFIKCLKLVHDTYVAGTDNNPYHIEFADDINTKYLSPRHDSNIFLDFLKHIIESNSIAFLHPHPSSEAKVVASAKLDVKTYLPRPEDIGVDKLTIYKKMKMAGVPVPDTISVIDEKQIEDAFSRIGSPLWTRAKSGAGGRLSLKVSSVQEAKYWIMLNVSQKRAKLEDFIIQEYLNGKDLAFDSLWSDGRLVLSFARERIEYHLKNTSLSGITGTPSVSRIVHDGSINKIGEAAVKALNPSPHGFYSVDMKKDNGAIRITEVDGKWHTTSPLWSYGFSKLFNDPTYNIVETYLNLGFGSDKVFQGNDIFPEATLIRQLDCGSYLMFGTQRLRIDA